MSKTFEIEVKAEIIKGLGELVGFEIKNAKDMKDAIEIIVKELS